VACSDHPIAAVGHESDTSELETVMASDGFVKTTGGLNSMKFGPSDHRFRCHEIAARLIMLRPSKARA